MRSFNKINQLLGIAVILLSLSYGHLLFPFPFLNNDQRVLNIEKMMSDVPEYNISSKSSETFAKEISENIKAQWVENLLFILWGVATGLLIIKHYAWGRYNAIVWSGSLLLSKIILNVQIVSRTLPDISHTIQRFKVFYGMMLENQPATTILDCFVATLLYIIVFAFLIRPSSKRIYV